MNRVLGIDIGSFSVKVAEIQVSSKGHVLNQFFEYALSVDPQKDKHIEIIEILRELATKYDPTTTKWVVSVPQNRVSVHLRKFPFRERPKILKSLAFELEDDIPLDIEETIFDAKIVEFVGAQAECLAVACPMEAIEELLSVTKDGGIDPEIVGVEGLSLSTIYENWNAPPPEIPLALRDPEEAAKLAATLSPAIRLVLNLGHTRTLLLVYRDEGLVGVRSLQWGGSDLIQALMAAFNVPVFEAVKILQTKSFILMNSAGANKDQLLLSKTISSTVDLLMHDLRMTLLEVRAAFGGAHFTGIELMGGVSQIQNLGAYMTQALEIPANVSHHLQNRPSRLQVNPHIEAVSAVAIGLAIEGIRKPRNPAVNLRKGDFARENLTLKRFWQTWRVPVQIAATAFGLFLVFSLIRDSMASSLLTSVYDRTAELAQKVAGLKLQSEDDPKLDRYIRDQESKIKSFAALSSLDGYRSALDFVARLAEKLPVQLPPAEGRGLDVTRLQIENDDLIIEGRAEPSSIAGIEKGLKEIAVGGKISSSPKNAVPPGKGTPFAYKMKVKRKL